MLRALIDFAPVADGSYGTATLEPFAETLALSATNGVTATSASKLLDASGTPISGTASDDDAIRVEVNDQLFRVRFVDLPRVTGGASAAAAAPVRKGSRTPKAPTVASGDDVVAPMHGVVVEMPVAAGADVASGDVVAVIEAMKMMNEIRAHRAGTVAALHVAAGATVEAQTPLLTLTAVS
jgi:biotin carboxyl carrier protein